MTTPDQPDPVLKSRPIDLDVATTFELFTQRLDEWWPLDIHSLSGGSVAEVRFDGYVGGRLVEVSSDGTHCSWADVLAWNPPHRFVLSWHPDREPTAASRMELRFDETDTGTQVNIHHSGWEEFGDDAERLRGEYDRGWEVVLAAFTAAASQAR